MTENCSLQRLALLGALAFPIAAGCAAAGPNPIPAAAAAPVTREIRADCGDSPTGEGGPMCRVPAGEFMMGCNEAVDAECLPHESPYHRVHLDEFLIDRHEVTVAAYRECVAAGACEPPEWDWVKRYCNWRRGGRDDHPINCVEWYHARDYCRWVGKRLPTEAEWEKAARGTDGRKYPWGNAPVSCEVAVIDDGQDGCGANRTWPVCSKPAGIGPYGTCDTIGNTYEWTADWYAEDYYERSPARDPQGPASGELRVLRGGSWNRQSDRARASHRVGYPADDNPYCRGFRCALDTDTEGR
jgi:formylglycine-generating enzyme required for sulfatase activity